MSRNLEGALGLRDVCPTHGIVLSRGVSSVLAGIQPSCFWRAKISSRSLSQPWSNLPLYLSAHCAAT